MRPIEFRGLPVVNHNIGFKYWYHYEEWHYANPCVSIIRSNEWQLYIVSPETIWQYTWLEDKNWVKIFEWDIINYYDKKILEVKLIKWAFILNDCTKYNIWYCEQKHLEVIGNIYENPELLNLNKK